MKEQYQFCIFFVKNIIKYCKTPNKIIIFVFENLLHRFLLIYTLLCKVS